MTLHSLPRASVKAERVHLNAEHNPTPASTKLCLGVKESSRWWVVRSSHIEPRHTHFASLCLQGIAMSTLGPG